MKFFFTSTLIIPCSISGWFPAGSGLQPEPKRLGSIFKIEPAKRRSDYPPVMPEADSLWRANQFASPTCILAGAGSVK